MHWTNIPLILISIILYSCDLHEADFNNPLDTEAAVKKNIYPPAFVFFPDSVATTIGGSIAINIFAMEIENVGMAQIEVNYDPNKLSVSSVSKGSLFQGENQPFFIYDDDENGHLTIYTTYLGPDAVFVSGTGDIALLVFTTRSSGQTTVSIGSESILLDPDAKQITLNGYGQSVINVQ